jgi:FkbM family methyltransferase
MTVAMPVPFALRDITTFARTAYGDMLVLNADHPRGTMLIKTGWAPDKIEIVALCGYMQVKGRQAMAIDCGANMGTHTLALAQYCAQVHSFEPQPIVYHVLEHNVRWNELRNVTLYNAAVGRPHYPAVSVSVPIVDYHERQDIGMVQMQPRTDLGQHVALVALDDVFADTSRVDLIKIDVEGMECEALSGASDLIRRTRPLLFVEWLRSGKKVLIEQLRDLGYVDIQTVGINLLAKP